MIELRNVSKAYDGVNVVDDVSLIIEEGQITSFIGPNGAEKHTAVHHEQAAETGWRRGVDRRHPTGRVEQLGLGTAYLHPEASNAINMRLTAGVGEFWPLPIPKAICAVQTGRRLSRLLTT